ncbi:hypothetical protein [Oligoflexus tunisiensis]|uniref:hypothetical protein n=1 Tax=Oligoflexus tunisiensis TaxID=708132 RepID=UPI00114CD62C|nr:hypothetical protein [Oligoflexus tunisiensis]
MCIICLEFNRKKDLEDARIMVEAARREVSNIPEEHLKKVEEELKKRQPGDSKPLDVKDGKAV